MGNKGWEVVRFRKYFEGSRYKLFCLVDFKERARERIWLRMSPRFLNKIPGMMVLTSTKMEMFANGNGFGESTGFQF